MAGWPRVSQLADPCAKCSGAQPFGGGLIAAERPDGGVDLYREHVSDDGTGSEEYVASFCAAHWLELSRRLALLN
jgi:hypothetical protein